MINTTEFRPDEIMFNTLLDGCARQGMFDRGLQILQEMDKANVHPTNFTLSVLVKLASRSKKLEKAFEFCKDLPAKYRFRLNVHVYNNLMNACIGSKDLDRASGVLEKMLSERVRPDTRTYSLLLKAFISAGEGKEAAGLLRTAVGHRDVHPRLARFESRQLQPQGGLPNAFIADTLQGIAVQCRDERQAVSLLKELREIPSLKLDPKLQLRLATAALRS
jgi:pentatricopeptide repeat protein